MEDMSRASFTIAYDGEALRDHSMDVQTLAPALMGFGTLMDAANRVVNGDESKIKLQIKALEGGSFQIVFEIVETFYRQIRDILTGPDATAAANLITFLGFTSGVAWNLLRLLKEFHGKNPDKISKLDPDTLRLQFGDQTIEVPVQVVRLFQDVSVRTAVEKVISDPLKSKGIDSFYVRDRKTGEEVINVSSDESVYYNLPEIGDDIVSDVVYKSAFTILSLAFKDDNKWRLNGGDGVISARIEDEEFLKRVDNSEESFSKGDILFCEVRLVQKKSDSGLKNEYTIIRVLDHHVAARQIPMNFDD